MAKLTKAQIKKYIKSEGSHCPYCNSKNIKGVGDLEASADAKKTASCVEEEVCCNSCGKHWFDVLSLSNVSEVED